MNKENILKLNDQHVLRDFNLSNLHEHIKM